VPAELFYARLLRAVALIAVATMAHIFVVRAPQPAEPDRVTVTELSQMRHNPSNEGTAPVAELPRVTVQTRIVPVEEAAPVGTAGILRAGVAASDSSVSTGESRTGQVQRAVDTAPGEIGVAAADLADTPQPVPSDSQTGNGTEDAPGERDRPNTEASLRLTPLAALRRPSNLPARIAAPVGRNTAAAPGRVIITAPIVEPDQKTLVEGVLQQYVAAYEQLDVDAAKVVYPTVNGSALRRAFSQLEAQRFTFESCGITISGRGANARCQGEASYRPRVGPRTLHASREWTFDLAKADDGWQIVKATVR
jgi:hypothetical protein